MGPKLTPQIAGSGGKALSSAQGFDKTLLEKSRSLVAWLALVILLFAVAAYWTSAQYASGVRGTLETADFIRNLDELFSTVQDAETGQRGYLLTGSEEYLRPYTYATTNIDRELAETTADAHKAGVATSRLSDLNSAIAGKMSELALTLRLFDAGKKEEALAQLRSGRGRRYMSAVRQIIHDIRVEQNATFDVRDREQRTRQRFVTAVLAVGIALASLFIVLARRFSALYARDRDRVEAEIRAQNERLEQRVSERTGELEQRTRESEEWAKELSRSNADLAQFASIASHDLQEPLRMIASYMALLERRYKGALDEAADTYIQFAIGGAARMQALINDLLAYSRAGTQAITKKRVQVSILLKQALENLQLAIAESKAVLQVGQLPEVEADSVKLIQVLQNLIGNALKFGRQDLPPEIRISAREQRNDYLFEVSDNGIGFDPKYCDRIFQVFQRLHGVGKYPGNGIGLAICRRIVEHHGGRLWAESQPGVGSTFFFTLPRPGSPEPGARVSPMTGAQRS